MLWAISCCRSTTLQVGSLRLRLFLYLTSTLIKAYPLLFTSYFVGQVVLTTWLPTRQPMLRVPEPEAMNPTQRPSPTKSHPNLVRMRPNQPKMQLSLLSSRNGRPWKRQHELLVNKPREPQNQEKRTKW